MIVQIFHCSNRRSQRACKWIDNHGPKYANGIPAVAVKPRIFREKKERAKSARDIYQHEHPDQIRTWREEYRQLNPGSTHQQAVGYVNTKITAFFAENPGVKTDLEQRSLADKVAAREAERERK